MDLGLDIGVVRLIGAVIVAAGLAGWWYAAKKMKR